MKQIIKKELIKVCNILKEKESWNFDINSISFEINYGTNFGDYSSNICFSIAKLTHQSPKELSEKIIKLFNKKEYISEVFEKNNFLNFNINRTYLNKYVLNFPKNKIKFNKTNKKIQVEFVSANPTGPLTIANARGGFYGNALANILKFTGNDVTKEYYINDKGKQIFNLAISILKSLNINPTQEYIEDNLYKGSYVKELANKIEEQLLKEKKDIKKLTSDKDIEYIGKLALESNLKDIKRVLKQECNINYDSFFKESSLTSYIKKVINLLKESNLTYEKEGAIFLKTTEFNDDKDRVIIRSDKTPTYFLTDIAYHLEKFSNRNFDKVIDIFGADHYTEANQLKTVVEYLKIKNAVKLNSKLDIILMQFLTIKNGEKMSKRKGNFTTLEEFINIATLDAANFFILERSVDKHLEFDINLAQEQSEKNPVFYTQYAYARICSILRKNKFRINFKTDMNLLKSEEEIKLMKLILKLPNLISEISSNYQVHLLTNYLMDLSKTFHAFYTNNNILKSKFKLRQARINLIKAVKTAFEISFKLINIQPKEKM